MTSVLKKVCKKSKWPKFQLEHRFKSNLETYIADFLHVFLTDIDFRFKIVESLSIEIDFIIYFYYYCKTFKKKKKMKPESNKERSTSWFLCDVDSSYNVTVMESIVTI